MALLLLRMLLTVVALDLFDEIATTLVHAITVDELHKEMHDMNIAARFVSPV